MYRNGIQGRAAVAFRVVGRRNGQLVPHSGDELLLVAAEIGEKFRHPLQLFAQDRAGDVGYAEFRAAEERFGIAVELVTEECNAEAS